MLRRTGKACLPLALSVGVIAAVGATAVPAAASTPRTGVTVFLKARHLADLRQLAAARGLSHSQRVRALQPLLPSTAQRERVIDALRAAGLTVTNQTAWSISATGPSAAVTDTFGTHAPMRAHATAAQRRAATGPYPTLPASLRGAAAAAYPNGTGPAMFHHLGHGTLIGSDFRNAYTSADLTSRGQAPYDGSDPAATLTIATVQFAGWNPGDLASWANTPDIGVPGFNAATGLTTVPVDQASVPAPTTDDDGDIEVDLDQEAILSTGPFAHQRPYFAPNDASGYLDALSQILDDVTQDANAYQGGDPHIVALSTSWGLCELDTGAAVINAMEPVLTSLLAAGVTIFASSGDDGIYDQCSTSGPHVDYPASSPEVIGVGGTSLSAVGSSSPNNGTNWLETAWSCTSPTGLPTSCDTNGGSGGGVSGDEVSPGFAKPAYQDVLQSAPFSQTSRRMVPDISANADPDAGFPVYTSDPGSGPGYGIAGGTSLAAPVSAALFTNALAAHAATSGVGEVHSALYAAYAAKDNSFRDITSGSNGAAADAGGDPSVNAGPGYDTVTGLGAPLWPKIVDRVLNPLAAPTATAALSLVHPHSASSPNQVTARWSGSAASHGLDVQNASVRIARAGHSGSVFSESSAPASGSHTFAAKPGSTYVLTVTARDIAGTTSATKSSTLVVPIDDKDFNFFGVWQRRKGNADVAGSLAQTSHRDASASIKASGKTYSLLVHTGPSYGKLAVAEGGHTLGVINLYSRHARTRRVTFFRAGSVRSRTFEFICLGTRSNAASSTTINVDALYVER